MLGISLKILIFPFLLLVSSCGSETNKSDIYSDEFLVTDDGNTLFYNGPNAVKANNFTFISFITKKGLVVVKKYKKVMNRYIYIEKYNVHNYFTIKNYLHGMYSDDHATPSIIYDHKKKQLLLTTSFHSSDVFIYKYDFNTNLFTLYLKIKGHFTYPRMIEAHNNIYIIMRSHNNGKGNLAIRTSSDNFSSEKIIVSAKQGENIYASKPALFKEDIYITYSVHKKNALSLRGWMYVKFNINKYNSEKTVSLNNLLDTDYYSNRPTAITNNGNNIIIGTALTYQVRNKNQNRRYYKLQNKILIISIENTKIGSVKKIHENFVLSPYYATSLTFNKDGDYFYFGSLATHSSKAVRASCFQNRTNYMFPSYFGDDVLYVSSNINNYSMKNFDTSLFVCQNVHTDNLE